MHVSITLAGLFYRSSASTETTFASTVGVLSFLPGSIGNFVRHASGPRGTPVLDVTSICYRSGVVSILVELLRGCSTRGCFIPPHGVGSKLPTIATVYNPHLLVPVLSIPLRLPHSSSGKKVRAHYLPSQPGGHSAHLLHPFFLFGEPPRARSGRCGPPRPPPPPPSYIAMGKSGFLVNFELQPPKLHNLRHGRRQAVSSHPYDPPSRENTFSSSH